MAERTNTRGPGGFPLEDFDHTRLPDINTNFLEPEHLEAFIRALGAPDSAQSPDDASSLGLESPSGLRSASSFDVTKRASSVAYSDAGDEIDNLLAAPSSQASYDQPSSPRTIGHRSGSNSSLFITAANDWAPVHEKVLKPGRRNRDKDGGPGGGSSARDQHGRRQRRARNVAAALGRRSKDETREGYLYGVLKWPFLLIVGAWIIGLAIAYLLTRTYIWGYEYFVAWRGTRERLRRAMRATSSYREWVSAAKQLDGFLGNERWKEENEFAYYDSKTVRRVWSEIRKNRIRAEAVEGLGSNGNANATATGKGAVTEKDRDAVENLRALIEACVKNNFAGVENPRLYSQMYFGTKNLVQNFVDEGTQTHHYPDGTPLSWYYWRGTNVRD